MGGAQQLHITGTLLALQEEDDELEQMFQPRKRQKSKDSQTEKPIERDIDDYMLEGSDVSDDDEDLDATQRRGPLKEWLVLDKPRRKISKVFRQFLATASDEKGNLVYPSRIDTMCSNNQQSLEVDYGHLITEQYRQLAIWLADSPTEMLEILDEVAMDMVLSQFPFYEKVCKRVRVRIVHLPIRESLRDLRKAHLNVLIKVTGVVTRRTAVFPQLDFIKYNCLTCNTLLGPYKQSVNKETKPSGLCPQCSKPGPFIVNSQETVYRNYQRITLQESPGTVPPGRLPRTKEVVLLDDLIDTVRPGEEVDVTGVCRHNYDFHLNKRQGFPVFATIIEANYVSKKEDALVSLHLDDADEKAIRALARDPHIGEKIVRSIAPSIFGHEDVKIAMAMALFGGKPKELATANGRGNTKHHHRIRGDINVLLMGDPGTAKSQFLKYVEKTAHRAVYATGQGASAVGLTASVRKDPVTREWTLEGGALVLADKGVCLIDEFDKMNDKDRTSIHEAMEQQSISISKAGIVTSLQARCSIIAAANPTRGRYDASLSFAQNVDLTEPILSRFDILCTVRDMVDPVQDEQLACFVVDSHVKSHPDEVLEQLEKGEKDKAEEDSTKDILSQEMLRKYIIYAKKNCHPRLQNIDKDRIKTVYSQLRSASMNGGLPMGVRHLESMLRMAEANARMHLRAYVREDDVNVAIKVMLDSFIGAQKLSVARRLRQTFRKFITFKKDTFVLLSHVLDNLVKEAAHFATMQHQLNASERVEVSVEDFATKAAEYNISDTKPFLSSKEFRDAGYILSGKKIIKET